MLPTWFKSLSQVRRMKFTINNEQICPDTCVLYLDTNNQQLKTNN